MSRNLLPRRASVRGSLTLGAVLAAAAAQADVPSVAVDIAPVHSLVARVMAGVGTPDLIVPPGASPHAYVLRPSEAGALQDADVVFWVSEGLTPWLAGSIATLAGNAAAVKLLEVPGTTELAFREGPIFATDADASNGGHAEGEIGDADHADDAGHAAGEAAPVDHDDHDHAHDDHDDRADAAAAAEDHDDHDHAHDDHEDRDDAAAAAHGHDHGGRDPHAWLAPENAKTWLDAIAGALSAADAANAGAYVANAAAGKAELDALIAEIGATVEPARGASFIVFHDAFQYFETSFGIAALGAIALGDGAAPSPMRIAEIRDEVADRDVTCVLSEPQFNPAMVRTVLDGTGSRTAVLDPLGADLAPGPDLYPQLLRNLARSIADCV